MVQRRHCVVIGAGHAGVQAAQALRQNGYEERITLVDAAPDLPYHRPPLSKTFLQAGGAAPQLLRPEGFFEANGIALLLGESVVEACAQARRLGLASGAGLDFDDLVIATGCSARAPVPGVATPPDVLTLRSLADARRLRDAMAQAGSVLLIGGGFVGLELAHSLRVRGLEVSVLERAARVLGRVASLAVSAAAQRHLKHHGITLCTDVALSGFLRAGGRTLGVEAEDGRRFYADLIVFGTGVEPEAALARQLGLTMGNGIVVDAGMRASRPHVHAIGDLASRLDAQGRGRRLESVHNALEQGRIVAATLTGKPAPPPEAPWFWSDQGKLKLQMVGLAEGADDWVLSAPPDSESFSVFCYRAGRLLAVESVNDARTHALARRMLGTGHLPPPAVAEQGAPALAEWLQVQSASPARMAARPALHVAPC